MRGFQERYFGGGRKTHRGYLYFEDNCSYFEERHLNLSIWTANLKAVVIMASSSMAPTVSSSTDPTRFRVVLEKLIGDRYQD